MFVPFELSPRLRDLAQENRKLSAQFRKIVAGPVTRSSRAEGEPIFQSPASSWCMLEHGFAAATYLGKICAFFEPGDTLFHKSENDSTIKLQAFSAIEIALMNKESVTPNDRASLIDPLAVNTHELLEEAKRLIDSIRLTDKWSFHFVTVGAPIIIEDTEPEDVYIMLAGSARVYVKDAIVGSVLSGEIFGAMAASLSSRRTASVIAKEPCVVAALPKGCFFELARTYPQTMLKLIEDMARIIVHLNEKIAAMSV